jgi:hypothetical protein
MFDRRPPPADQCDINRGILASFFVGAEFFHRSVTVKQQPALTDSGAALWTESSLSELWYCAIMA